MSDVELPGDVMNLDISPPDDERQWVVLFEGDYDNVMIDSDDRVALLVDGEQAGELLRLSAMAIAAIANRGDGDEVLQTLVESIEEEISDE